MATINVTQAHIDEGVPGEPDRCPIALAVRTDFIPVLPPDEHYYVDVGDDGITINSPSLRVLFPLSPERSAFIYDFDDHRHVEPFSFTLNVADGFDLLGDLD